MRKTKIDDALTIALEHLRPPPDETLPQWIERAVRLPEGTAVCTENLNPDVVVMKPAKDRV